MIFYNIFWISLLVVSAISFIYGVFNHIEEYVAGGFLMAMFTALLLILPGIEIWQFDIRREHNITAQSIEKTPTIVRVQTPNGLWLESGEVIYHSAPDSLICLDGKYYKNSFGREFVEYEISRCKR